MSYVVLSVDFLLSPSQNPRLPASAPLKKPRQENQSHVLCYANAMNSSSRILFEKRVELQAVLV